MTPSSISGDIEVPASVDAQGNVHIGHQIVHNYYTSTDWKKLQQRLTDALENYRSFPEHFKFAEQLQKVQDEIESFKRDVLKLAQEFQKIPLNTERLKQAKTYFDQGDYEKARGVLDTEALGQEQEVLLAEKDAVETKLAANADEFMLLAQLTAMNFDLGEERIPKACDFFQKAILTQKTPMRLFEYAFFLQEENRRTDSIYYYQIAFLIYRYLIEANHTINLPHHHLLDMTVALQSSLTKFNDYDYYFNSFQDSDPFRHVTFTQEPMERNPYYKHREHNILLTHSAFGVRPPHFNLQQIPHVETISINHDLSQIYTTGEPYEYTAQILNNLALLFNQDNSMQYLAKEHLEAALNIYRTLAEKKPDSHLSNLAKILNNLALVTSEQAAQFKITEAYYHEALLIQRKLAKEKPEIYRYELAEMLNNVATLLIKEKYWMINLFFAEKHMNEALHIYRNTKKEKSILDLSNTAKILNNLAVVSSLKGYISTSLKYYEEALKIRRSLAEIQPMVYKPKIARTLLGQGQAYLRDHKKSAALASFEEALELITPFFEEQPRIYGDLYEAISRYKNHVASSGKILFDSPHQSA